MTCNREDEFPLTYGLMKDLYYTKMPDQVKVHWLWPVSRLPATKEQRSDNLFSALREVKQPIWSLVEDLLLGKYDVNAIVLGKSDTLVITIGGQEFKVSTIYHMHVETQITPDVTENEIEYLLFKTALQQTLKYEAEGKYRDKLMGYYEERV